MYTLSHQRGEEIKYIPGIPRIMSRYRIPAASRAFHVLGRHTIQLFQQIEGRHFDAWSMHFAASQSAVLYSKAEKPVLALHFALKNYFDYNLKGIGDILLPQRQFNLTYAPGLEGYMKVKSNQHYWYFEVHPPFTLLEELVGSFPGLERFVNDVIVERTAMLNKQHTVATIEILDVIHSILYNQFEGELRELYLETKVLELVLLCLHQSLQGKKVSSPVVLTAHDMEKLEQARAYLVERIDERTSITDLSHIIKINRNKLTVGFKQVHGMTIFDFVIDTRMEKAKALLLETKIPIGEVATMIGYSKLSNFTTAFTRKFGYPPSVFRDEK